MGLSPGPSPSHSPMLFTLMSYLHCANIEHDYIHVRHWDVWKIRDPNCACTLCSGVGFIIFVQHRCFAYIKKMEAKLAIMLPCTSDGREGEGEEPTLPLPHMVPPFSSPLRGEAALPLHPPSSPSPSQKNDWDLTAPDHCVGATGPGSSPKPGPSPQVCSDLISGIKTLRIGPYL